MTDIIVFSGQSNMEGQTEKLLDSSPVENAYEYKYATDSLIVLRDPFGENLRYDGTQGVMYEDQMGMSWHAEHALGGSAYGNSTLVAEFCRVYIEKTKRSVIAVGAAKGAETVEYFSKGGRGYDIIVKKTNAAKKHSNDLSGNVYLVWLQGESDALESKSKEKYIEQIKKAAEDLKDDIGLTRFCVIRVGRFTNDERDLQIIEAQDEVCKTDPLFLMLTDEATELNKIPEYMNPEAAGHFSAAGLYKLGRDAANALADEVMKNEAR